MGLKHFNIQLASAVSGRNITEASGNLGTVMVVNTGTARKTSLYNKDGTAASNPFQMTNGKVEFYTQDSVASVDIYGQSPAGRPFVEKAAVASGISELYIDNYLRQVTLLIPFDGHDQTAGTEQDTAFNLPTNAVVLPFGIGIDVLTAQSAKTINVGVLSTEANGSATGFMNAVSLAAAATVFPAATVTTGVYASTTYGAFLADSTAGTNADDRGFFNRKEYVCDGTAISVSYTTSSGTTTAAGIIKIPMVLPA